MSSHLSPARTWFDRLLHEFFQTERSAMEHPRKEAERLGDTPPAHAMLAVAAHAEESLERFKALVNKKSLGEQTGKLFSILREGVGDRPLTSERSYRGTLLGMAHGLDLGTVAHELARGLGEAALADFFASWLAQRQELVQACRAELSWFVEHPERADALVKSRRKVL